MQQLNEEITEDFIEKMVDKVIKRLSDKLDALDISMDFLASIMSGEGAASLQARQKSMGRHSRAIRRAHSIERGED